MDDLNREHELDAELERELSAALRPLSAPTGFADRLIAHTRELPQIQSSKPVLHHRAFSPAFRWAIAAVLLVAVSVGGFFEHQRRRRVAGEHARDQVLLALRITTVTLRAVKDHVDKNTSN